MRSDDRDRPGRRTQDAFDGDPTGTGLAIALVMLAFELVRVAVRSLVRLVRWTFRRGRWESR